MSREEEDSLTRAGPRYLSVAGTCSLMMIMMMDDNDHMRPYHDYRVYVPCCQTHGPCCLQPKVRYLFPSSDRPDYTSVTRGRRIACDSISEWDGRQ